ncbi:MAG: hypothetical protein OEZ19_00130 [Paracoccaceae bacterium]|nr:hypothetical protein [Paracoccaceae bacterium]
MTWLFISLRGVWRAITGPVGAFFATPFGRWIGKALLIILTGGAALLIARRDAAKDARAEDKMQDLQEDLETVRRVQNETASITDADDARRVLLARQSRDK